MIIAGLTGSIGMGKSTTAKMFIDEGIPVHDSDAVVHALYEGEAAILIDKEFPGTAIDGRVDRAKLGQHVVGNDDAMRRLEALVHPLVSSKREEFLTASREAGAKLVVLDIPLLFETGGHKLVDKIIVVTASAETQRERVLSRPGMSEEKFAAILSKQMPDAIKRKHADYIIDTDLGLDHARECVRQIISDLT